MRWMAGFWTAAVLSQDLILEVCTGCTFFLPACSACSQKTGSTWTAAFRHQSSMIHIHYKAKNMKILWFGNMRKQYIRFIRIHFGTHGMKAIFNTRQTKLPCVSANIKDISAVSWQQGEMLLQQDLPLSYISYIVTVFEKVWSEQNVKLMHN